MRTNVVEDWLGTFARAARFFGTTALVMTLVACGGGGGGGGGGSGSTPTPTPSPGGPVTPRPSVGPTPTAVPGGAKVILGENDAVAGLDISDIEDAAFDGSGRVAAIITVRGTGGARAVLVGGVEDEFSVVLEPSAPPPGADLATLGRVRLSENGIGIFQSGEGLDSDRLYEFRDGGVTALAGAEPGVVTPDFRILGDVAIGATGVVGIVAGGDECELTQVGESTRALCTIHLFIAENGSVTEADPGTIDLDAVSPTRPQVAVTDAGVTFFSVPGAGEEPTLLRFSAGQRTTVLSADDDLEDVGRLLRPQIAAATADEDLLLTTTLRSDEGPSRPTVLGILSGDTFTILDREREPDTGGEITDLRAIGMDEQGSALYVARIGEEGDTQAPRTLRLSDGFTKVDIATERQLLPGSDKTVISIDSQRINRRGDVAFLVRLGRIDGLTTIIEEVRIGVRLADGTYLAPVSSARPGNIGTLTGFSIAGFDDQANLLVLATREQASQTVLLFAPPQEP